MDKLTVRDDKCRISEADGFLRNSIQGVKRTLAKAFIDRQSSIFHVRERRQIGRGESIVSFEFQSISRKSFSQAEGNLTCNELRRLGSAVSALTLDQISTIDGNQIFECVGVFGSVNDFSQDKLNKLAEKYISVEEEREGEDDRTRIVFLGVGDAQSTCSVVDSS